VVAPFPVVPNRISVRRDRFLGDGILKSAIACFSKLAKGKIFSHISRRGSFAGANVWLVVIVNAIR
jgi:hypothetical protein